MYHSSCRFCFFGEPGPMASPHTILTKFLSLALRRYCLCTKRGSHHIIMIFYHDVTAQPQCGPWIPLHGYNIVSREISALRPPCHRDSAVALPSALRPLPCGHVQTEGCWAAGRRVRGMVSEPLMVWEPPGHGLGLGGAIPDGSLAAPRLLPGRRY